MKAKFYTFLLCCLFFIIISKAQVNIQTIVPPSTDTISVCLDTFQVQIIIVNDTLQIDNVAIQHIFPQGIFLTNIVFSNNVDSFDISNTNQPLFFTDSLNTGDSIIIVLSAFAGCDFSDSIALDTTNVTYLINDNLNFQQDISNSYNVERPDININVLLNSSLSGNVGDSSFFREIVICNNGFGSLDSLSFTIDIEPEIILDSLSMFNTKVVNIPFTIVGNQAIVTFSDSLIKLIPSTDGDSLLELDECIVIREHFTITSCTPDPNLPFQTTYSVSWGCNNQICQTDTTNANVTVLPGSPAMRFVPIDSLFIPTSYCDTTPGQVGFLYTNLGNDGTLPPGAGVATDLKIFFHYNIRFFFFFIK